MSEGKRKSYQPKAPKQLIGRGEDAILDPAGVDVEKEPPKLLRRTYYLRPDQLLWLKQQTVDKEKAGASPEDSNLSAIVREAIDRLREAEA